MKSGLAALKEIQKEAKERAERRDSFNSNEKVNWFGKYPDGADSVEVTFLQELDETSPLYDPARGTVVMEVEHSNPDNWIRRATCTLDEEEEYTPGVCFGCDMNKAGHEGWYQKTNMYINVLADLGEGVKTYILSRGATTPFATALTGELKYEDGITDATYEVGKPGGKSSWTLRRLKMEALDSTDAKVYNLEEVALRNIPFDKQQKYYGISDKDIEFKSSKPADVPASNQDDSLPDEPPVDQDEWA